MIFVGVVERVRPVTTCARQKLYHSVAFPAHMWTPGTPAARPTTGGKEPGCRLWQLGDRRPWTASGTGWPGPATSLPEVPATTGSRKYPGRPLAGIHGSAGSVPVPAVRVLPAPWCVVAFRRKGSGMAGLSTGHDLCGGG